MENYKVFVYGTLKKGFNNHYLLDSSEFLGNAHSLSKFNMINLGGFPALLYNSDIGYSVTGELYNISPNTLKELDILEGEGSFYERVEDEFFVIGNNPRKNGQKFRAFVYILKDMPYSYDYNNIYLNTKNYLTYERT